MKTASFFLVFLILMKFCFGQIFFKENFNYADFEEFRIISKDRERWTFFHSENQDFNNNGRIDKWENIKITELVEFEDQNKAIRFFFRKMDTNILKEDVMKNGEIDGVKTDYLTFFTNINRNEIATWDDPDFTAYQPNRKYEFSFDVLIPDEFEFEKDNCENPASANYEISGQWHLSYDVLSGNTMPPVSLRIVCDSWMLNLNPDNNPTENNLDFVSLGKIEKGKWVNWKFQIRFSPSEKGYIRLFQNEELIFSKEKTKTIFSKKTDDGVKSTIYFKIGLYKPHWWSRISNVSEREIYFDKVIILK